MINNLDEAIYVYEELLNRYKNVIKLNDFLSDRAEDIRGFSEMQEIEFHLLRDTIHTYEKNFFIKCYTFSEQLIKQFFYFMISLSFDNTTVPNNHSIVFLENTYHKDKFNPNIKIHGIELLFTNFLSKNQKFDLILYKNSVTAKSFDNMVSSRHLYAHTGSYVNTSNFDLVFDYINYLISNVLYIKSKGINVWLKLTKLIKKLKNTIRLTSDQLLKNHLNKNKIKELKNDLIQIINDVKSYQEGEYFETFFNEIESILLQIENDQEYDFEQFYNDWF